MSLPPAAPDSELFTALRGGDERALEELFRRYYTPLCRVAIRFVTEPAAAEDIVQELFAGLWSRRASLPEEPPTVGPYLRRATRNRSLNYLRDRKRLPLDDGELPELPTDGALLPGASMEQDELRQRLYQAIDKLPERCRLVFVMSKVEEMSHREIAEGLDISVKTVENQMTRAYKFLRQWLALFIPLIIVTNA